MPASTPHPPITRRQEIALVAGRELRAQLFKRSAVVSTLVMLALVVGGIVVAAYLTDDDGAPYRLGTRQVPAAMVPAQAAQGDREGDRYAEQQEQDEADAEYGQCHDGATSLPSAEAIRCSIENRMMSAPETTPGI